MFSGAMELPTFEQMKYNYDASRQGPAVSDTDENNFKKLGYSDEKINKIKEQLRLAGLME